MAAKRDKKPSPSAIKAAARKKTQAVLKPNPFEFKTSKPRFETLGRKLKGASKNVVQAKQDAVTKRKRTLLVEYRQLRKANTFVDKRFGDDEEGLLSQDRLVTSKPHKTHKARKLPGKESKFTLGGDEGLGEEEGLTHLGRSLAEIEDLRQRPEGDDDVDDEVMAEAMREYNFGGGATEARGADGKPKSKKEVMEEIIARSKAFKAEKAKQKEEDEKLGERLDADFRSLLAGRSLASLLKPPGFEKGVKVKPDDALDARYDQEARELALEARGAPGERTLTAEELETKEAERLQKLERERLKRMREAATGLQEDGADDGRRGSVGGADAALGGYAARRKKNRSAGSDDEEDEEAPRRTAQSGDAMEDDFIEDSSDDEEGEEGGSPGASDDEDGGEGGPANTLEKRRRMQAAGDHPLQDSFREAAAALAAKYGVKVPQRPANSDDDDGDDDDDDEGEDDGEGGEDEDEGAEGEESGDEDGAGGKEAEEEGAAAGAGADVSGSDEGQEDGDDEDDDGSDDDRANPKEPAGPSGRGRDTKADALAAAAAAPSTKGKGSAAAAAIAAIPAEQVAGLLPFTLPVPERYEQFAALVAGRPPADLAAAVHRIRTCNVSALAADSKHKLQVFYGILVQHFATLAGQAPLPVAHLDTLVPILVTSTAEVPYYATLVARERIKRMHDQLSAGLTGTSVSAPPQSAAAATVAGAASGRSAMATKVAAAAAGGNAAKSTSGRLEQGEAESSWPSGRSVLLMKLFAMLFPASDRRHPVITPLTLLVGKCLTHLVACTPHEAATGLVLSGLATHLAAPAQRHAPEPVTFVTDFLHAFATGNNGASHSPINHSDDKERLARVVPSAVTLASPKAAHGVAPAAPRLMELLSPTPGTADATGDAMLLGLLQVALASLRRLTELYASSDACPALLQPAVDALRLLAPGSPSNGVKAAGQKVLRLPDAVETDCTATLKVLQDACAAAVARRRPMVQASRCAPPTARTFNPRFEDEFARGRDHDPDRERAEARKLKKMVTKEKRGAQRELRRDGAFLSVEREKEKQQVDAERMESQKKFYAELQTFEANMRSGGAGGMNPHLKNKRSRNKDRK